MAKNFIIIDNGGEGRTVNLETVMDILYGGDIPSATADQQKTVFIYQTATTNATTGAKTRPSYILFQYSSTNLAKAVYNRIRATMAALGYIGDDLRKPLARIDSLDVATAPAATPTTITLAGDGFSASGKITVNGEDLTTTYISAQSISFSTGTSVLSAGGPYDVEYTEPNGKAAKKAAALTIT